MNKYQEHSKADEIREKRISEIEAYIDNQVKHNMHYVINNRSVNATKARANGEKPWNEWSFEKINKRSGVILKQNGFSVKEISEAIDLMNCEGLPYVRGHILKITHRHHEGASKACIPFYVIDPEWLIKFIAKLKRSNNQTAARTA